MQYNISITENIVRIILEGSLSSLDLMFMLWSKDYKTAINQYQKVLIDYTHISGVTLKTENMFAITMLGISRKNGFKKLR